MIRRTRLLQIFIFEVISLSITQLAESQNCDPNAKYRTLSGECNNLANPYWGSSPRTHSTSITQVYADGKECPRASMIANKSLPLARVLSLNVMYQADKPDDPNGIDELHVFYGMFLAHDMALSFPSDNSAVDCTLQCPLTKMMNTGGNLNDEKCLQFTFNYGRYCNGSDVKNCGCSTCPAGQLQHLNFMTSYIDLSNVYAINKERNMNIRETGTAKFAITKDNLLPLAATANENDTATPCIQPNRNDTGPCILSAEGQGNISPFLQGINTLFVREHNRLVDKLKDLFKDEDTLFEEVRRINIAFMQHIVYNEYLPSILGECMKQDLKVPSENYQYDSSIDATITKEFITGAFRFGHTQPKNNGSLGDVPDQVPFGQLYSVIPYITAGPDVIEKEMEAMFNDRAKLTDQYYNDQMVKQFKFSNNLPFGDLAAIDVERGRLHGVPSYAAVRRHYNLPVPKDLDGLSTLMPKDIIEDFKIYYGDDSVENLDLHLASMAEYKVPNCKGIMFGETYKCIIEEEFRKLKFGDRYWYERAGQPLSFTDEQLAEIRKTTISGMVCRNTKLQEAPENGFYSTSKKRPCSELITESDIDVSKFIPSQQESSITYK